MLAFKPQQGRSAFVARKRATALYNLGVALVVGISVALAVFENHRGTRRSATYAAHEHFAAVVQLDPACLDGIVDIALDIKFRRLQHLKRTATSGSTVVVPGQIRTNGKTIPVRISVYPTSPTNIRSGNVGFLVATVGKEHLFGFRAMAIGAAGVGSDASFLDFATFAHKRSLRHATGSPR